MKKISLSLILFMLVMSVPGVAQVGLIPGANDPSKADLKVLTDDRALLSTTIRPTEGTAEGFVVGNDEGWVDINDLKLFLEGLRARRKASLGVQSAVDTHPAPVVTPKLGKIRYKRRKPKKLKTIRNNQDL